jgi:hypothetical protein
MNNPVIRAIAGVLCVGALIGCMWLVLIQIQINEAASTYGTPCYNNCKLVRYEGRLPIYDCKLPCGGKP